MSLKYGVTCYTCGRLTKWTNSPLTTCPTNPEHEINPESINIEERYCVE